MPELDVFFKEFLRIAFLPFLALFAPEVAARLSTRRAPEFLDTHFPTPESWHVVDLLAKVLLRSGKPALAHLEVQGQRQRVFLRRMHDYYHDVRGRHPDVDIYSLAVLTYRTRDAPKAGRFEEQRDGEAYHWFQYGIIPLADLDAREFVDSDNPVAHGLMGFYRRKGLDAVRLKAESLRHVVRLTQGEPALRHILLAALERYFTLTDEQQVRLGRTLAREGYEEVREVLTLTEERGMVRGTQETLLRLVREKFGGVPEDVEAVVRGMKSTEELWPYVSNVLRANSLEEMGFPTNGRRS